MAQEILIIGQSGTGKSTSLRNLNPAETVIINPTKKNLPFKGFRSNYTVFSKENPTGNLFNIDTNAGVVQGLLHINDKMPHIKNVIIDDANYLMAFEFINRAKENGYNKFTDIGTGFSKVITTGKDLRDDLNFIVMMHPEIDTDALGNKIVKAKTIGVCRY